MSPQARTLAILLVISLAGLVGLGQVARRYGRIVEERAAAAARRPGLPAGAPAEVEAFIAVRAAMARRIAESGAPSEAEIVAARESALAAAGLTRERYAAVRESYRLWRAGRLRAGPLGAAFEVRRERLDGVALGGYERLDL